MAQRQLLRDSDVPKLQADQSRFVAAGFLKLAILLVVLVQFVPARVLAGKSASSKLGCSASLVGDLAAAVPASFAPAIDLPEGTSIANVVHRSELDAKPSELLSDTESNSACRSMVWHVCESVETADSRLPTTLVGLKVRLQI